MRINHRVLGLLLSFAGFVALSQSLSPEGIKAKIDEAAKVNQSSMAAFAQNNVDEGRRLAEESAKLLREARAEYEAIGAGESGDPALLTDYADFLTQMGDVDLAEKVLLRAVEVDQENASVWLKLGQAEAALGPRSESRAIRSLRRAATIEPKTDATAKAYASLGALYQDSGLYDFAREAYSKSLELDPSHVGSKLAIASLDAREGRMIEAKATYDSVETASMEYGQFIKQTLGKALDEFDKSRRWLPDTAESHLAYAELLVRVDRLLDCYWPLNRSLMLDDQNFVAWNLMGSVLRAMNQPKPAKDAFVRSLSLKADQPRTAEAITALDQAISQEAAPTESPTSDAANASGDVQSEPAQPAPAPGTESPSAS